MDTQEIIDKLNSGIRLYSEITASDDKHRAWVGIFPFKGELRNPDVLNANILPWRYHIRKFDVKKDLLETGYDIHEEYLENSQKWIVNSVTEVLSLLCRWPMISLDIHPRDYPI